MEEIRDCDGICCRTCLYWHQLLVDNEKIHYCDKLKPIFASGINQKVIITDAHDFCDEHIMVCR